VGEEKEREENEEDRVLEMKEEERRGEKEGRRNITVSFLRNSCANIFF
jgi:hypothetical protein